mmetsp:Transcript_90688/g.219977  ORF Transcript_90688/g.219977 Transcript_90688/m.219977 type:complete len:604 (+) Transcript_90688:360-2171(+)
MVGEGRRVHRLGHARRRCPRRPAHRAHGSREHPLLRRGWRCSPPLPQRHDRQSALGVPARRRRVELPRGVLRRRQLLLPGPGGPRLLQPAERRRAALEEGRHGGDLERRQPRPGARRPRLRGRDPGRQPADHAWRHHGLQARGWGRGLEAAGAPPAEPVSCGGEAQARRQRLRGARHRHLHPLRDLRPRRADGRRAVAAAGAPGGAGGREGRPGGLGDARGPRLRQVGVLSERLEQPERRRQRDGVHRPQQRLLLRRPRPRRRRAHRPGGGLQLRRRGRLPRGGARRGGGHGRGGLVRHAVRVQGLRLGRLQEVTVSEEVRRRHKFLQHLALGTVVSWAEVDLRKHLSQETKDYFAEEFNKRRQQRKKEQIRGRREQRIGQSRAAEEEERYYQALNYTHPTTIQQRPTAEDFAVSLSGVVEEAARESEGDAAGAEGAGAAGEEGREAEDAGPTLADRIKGKVAAKARPLDRSFAFPELGGGSASGAGSAGAAQAGAAGGRGAGAATSAWGRGRGSDRVKKDSAASQDSAGPVATGWDDDEAGAPPGGPADEQPTFGQALEAALRSAEAEQPAGDAAEAEGAAAAGGKKKKGRAGKATTIRLFG